jgi:hypothetical protein
MMNEYDSTSKAGYVRAATEPRFGGSTIGGKACRPDPTKADLDVMRTFPDLSRRASIAQEAASVSFNELSEMISRLGIPRQYGQALGVDGGEPEPSGEVDSLTRAIERLTDTVRDIRGLAETLNASL